MVRQRPLAHEGGPDVALDVDPLVGEIRQLVRMRHRSRRRQRPAPERCRAHDTRDVAAGRGFPHPLDERWERDLAVSAHDVVDVAGSQAHLGVLGGEVAAPHDGQVGMAALELAAQRGGVLELGSGHDGHSEQIHAVPDHRVEPVERIVLEVAVDDPEVDVGVIEHRPEREQRHREDGLPAGAAPRVVESEHRTPMHAAAS